MTSPVTEDISTTTASTGAAHAGAEITPASKKPTSKVADAADQAPVPHGPKKAKDPVTRKPEYLPMSLIRTDGGTQAREEINAAVVEEYAEAQREGAQLPPVVLYHDKDGDTYWLADGFHRFHAHHLNGHVDILAVVRDGTRRDAVLHAVGANKDHGLRRTNGDKKKAAMTLLEDPEWGTWSDNKIAKESGVSPTTVGTYRASLSKSDSENPAERTYTTKHGTVATMKTAKIGNKKKAVAEERDDKAAQDASRVDSAQVTEKDMVDGGADNPVPDDMCASKPPEAILSNVPSPNEINDMLAEAQREIDRQRAHVAALQKEHEAELQIAIAARVDLERRLDEVESRETPRVEQLRVLGDQFAELRELLGVKSARAIVGRVKELVASSAGSTAPAAHQSQA
jgi:ParB-like chromosome segregation protein Spo0J